VNNGILLALLAYATYAWSDAAVKALGGSLSIFEIGFFQTLIAGACIYFAKPAGERWSAFWRMKRPWAVQARALFGLAGSVLGVFAFTTIPLAEVYAIIFLSPLFVTVLSMVFLKEKVGRWRWLAILGGFIGVLLVVRPGFRAIELGHLTAVVMAVLGASTVILMRSLSNHERQTTMLGFLIVYGLAFNGAAMALTSASIPNWQEAAILLAAGVFLAAGHILMLRATRFAPASHMATTHYSQMVWAVLIGAFLFHEEPDVWTIVGLAVIAGSGMLTMAREQVRLGRVRWNRLARNRL
jgi:drug/metabolite transporter (DMT)-like permease